MRRYHLILVDTLRSDESDFVVMAFKQKAGSPEEAHRIVSRTRLAAFAGSPGLELRVTDA
jgi:hypothetical protein